MIFNSNFYLQSCKRKCRNGCSILVLLAPNPFLCQGAHLLGWSPVHLLIFSLFSDVALWWKMRYVFYLRCGLMSMITPSPSRDSRRSRLGNTGGNTPSHMWTSRLGRYVGMHQPRDELSHSIYPLMVDQFGKQPSFKPAVNRSEISPNRIRVMLLAGSRIQYLGGSGPALIFHTR